MFDSTEAASPPLSGVRVVGVSGFGQDDLPNRLRRELIR
jgi:hypothetical protein